jgi:hypothetical protein
MSIMRTYQECAICHEFIYVDGDYYRHDHGDVECWTGDGSVAIPSEPTEHEFQPPHPALTDEHGQPLDPDECGECGEHHVQQCSANRGPDPASGCDEIAEPGTDYCPTHNAAYAALTEVAP